ncbi:TPA: ATP-binding protein [Vibrio parahaemolyticus]|uniref:ATP-binding protein n=1 Tax=Vibrio parahaemolyticus TaxID=670 RepID=UPI001E3C3C85|nr:ATP-binding protein [Vibrio parahaemolyticus]
MVKVNYNSLLVFNSGKDKCFYTSFNKGVNIVYGRNTSGKSTLIQIINYSMGINDARENLSDVLSQDVVVRLTSTFTKDSISREVIFIRSDESLIVQVEGERAKRFDGISGNTSYEYRKYKEFFSELLGFDLYLESKGNISLAPLEAAFLPFYISQSVGWVYLRESIGNYRFYKNFKEDYLDYCLGISNHLDRAKRYQLEEKKKEYLSEIKFIDGYNEQHPELEIAKEISERFKSGAHEFIESFNHKNTALIALEREHIELVNKKSALLMRKSVIRKVHSAQNKQRPHLDSCPVCEQALPSTLEALYKYNQELNDTIHQKSVVDENLKKIQSSINAKEKKLSESRSELVSKYKILQKLKMLNITFDTWIKYESIRRLSEDLDLKRRQVQRKLDSVVGELNVMGKGDVEQERRNASRLFLNIFRNNTKALQAIMPTSSRYRDVYEINSFPAQGVELHKLIMAYHFSFWESLKNNEKMHRLPFVLDAVFKEDIDEVSRKTIFEFLSSKNLPNEQIIFAVADVKENQPAPTSREHFIEDVNKIYFSSSAKLICIGNAERQRAFLSEAPTEFELALIEDTLAISEVY